MNTDSRALKILRARATTGLPETDMPTGEIAAAVAGGTVVVVKAAFDPAELRRLRRAILAWKAPASDGNPLHSAVSTRARDDDPADTRIPHAFESYLFAVENPQDAIGPQLRATFARLADYWRALTGGRHGFLPGVDGRCIRPRALYYPAGGGYFDWHAHPLEPHRVGLILGMSEIGVDHAAGGTEFRTPFGEVSTLAHHDIGDVCLFRYDLAHRVTPVDPGRARDWSGAGRWSLIIPVQ